MMSPVCMQLVPLKFAYGKFTVHCLLSLAIDINVSEKICNL